VRSTLHSHNRPVKNIRNTFWFWAKSERGKIDNTLLWGRDAFETLGAEADSGMPKERERAALGKKAIVE